MEELLSIKIRSIDIHDEVTLPKEVKEINIVNGKEIINVEMQIEDQGNIIDRSLNYSKEMNI